MLLQITHSKRGDLMESFLATLAFLGIAMVSVCGVVVLKIYNPNSNK